MAGNLQRISKSRWAVQFGEKGTKGAIYEIFDNFKDAKKLYTDTNKTWVDRRRIDLDISEVKNAIKDYKAYVKNLEINQLSKALVFGDWLRTKYKDKRALQIQHAARSKLDTSSKELTYSTLRAKQNATMQALATEHNASIKYLYSQNDIIGKVMGESKIPTILNNKDTPWFKRFKLDTSHDKAKKAVDELFTKNPVLLKATRRPHDQKGHGVLRGHLSERAGVDYSLVSKALKEHPEYKKNPRFYENIALGRYSRNFIGKPFDELVDYAETTGKTTFGKNVGFKHYTPEHFIQTSALRHWDLNKKHGNKGRIEFYKTGTNDKIEWKDIKPDDRGLKRLNYKKVEFTLDGKPQRWNFKTLGSSAAPESGAFNQVYKAVKDRENFLSRKVTNPHDPQGDKVSLRTLIEKFGKKGKSFVRGFAVDHGLGVGTEPFKNLRVLSNDLNLALAGVVHQGGSPQLRNLMVNEILGPLVDAKGEAFKTALANREVGIMNNIIEGKMDPLKPFQRATMNVAQKLKKGEVKLSQPNIGRLQESLTNLYEILFRDKKLQHQVGVQLGCVKGLAIGGAEGGRVPFQAGTNTLTCIKSKLQIDPDGSIAKIAEGPNNRIRNFARNIISKIPKGGRLGAILAGAGAVGAGTLAMMGGAEADTMKYNATTGQFDDAEGEPETQEGILNWIADNPIKSGLAPIPALLGASLFASAKDFTKTGKALTSFPALVAPALAAEKLYQYKEGVDPISMATDPLNVIFAAGWETKASAKAKEAFYKDPKNQRLFQMKNFKNPRAMATNIPNALRSAVMSPRAGGTKLMFGLRAGKELAPSGLARLGGMALRATPIGWGIGALSAANYGWNKYKDVRDTNSILDSMREQGNITEEDADTLRTIMKQGWLGTTSLGAKILGSEELELGGEMVGLDQQKQILDNLLTDVDTFQEGREDVTAKDRQQKFFSWFSDGGRVGMKAGGMDRRTFLKWIASLAATATGLIKGKGLTQKAPVAKAIPKAIAKFQGVEGMPAWFPRAVAKIKAHGKLIEMADKHYVDGDIYEMMIPVKVPKFDRVAGKEVPSGFETVQRKVTMEDNPLSGEISMQWTGTDNFGDDAVRQINFKPGESGYQKFGVDPEHPQAWEYERVKVSDPEFSYTQPDQSNPYRDDIEYLDIFEEGDEIVKGLEDMTGSKQMVTKDGTVIDVSAEGKGVDEAFQKKVYKDVEGEGALLPDPEGNIVGPEGDWVGESANEIIGGDIPDWVPKDEWPKKASGGIIETGEIARRPGAVPPLSGPSPDGIMSLYSNPKQVNVG